MALAGRLRSAFPLLNKALSAESSVLFTRSAAEGSLGNLSTGLRTFATQTQPTEAKVKVPLKLFGGSGNYATALFIAANKANALDKVEAEILDVVEASKRSPRFSKFIRDMSIPKKTRVKTVTEIFAEAGFSDVTKNFLAVLADNGRLAHIDRISKRFVELTMAQRGEVKVIVTTVIPLPAEEEKELKLTMQDILGPGKTAKIEQKIDTGILGGLVVEFENKVFDMSIKTRAKQMENFLREPINFDNL
ncbi:ATP synthase subunit O, mitochondrial-like [Zingiber officinale]|uniref:ATP synthase subunit O, mitochondrial-like n=1 Tax=Zingiber officinale TaxID=94328 RepID=UPI001C4CFC8E|nr:ATP synthase subunit O, mitochondrial-like [Zingiber officinale]